jgi:hypothetical protein
MNRNLFSDLYRTEDPKIPHYHADGNARDTYINSNNGGICPVVHAKGQSNEARFERAGKSPKPRVFGRLVNPTQRMSYNPDGTGRDTYISEDMGGSCAITSSKPPQLDFSRNDFLRNPSDYAGVFSTP